LAIYTAWKFSEVEVSIFAMCRKDRKPRIKQRGNRKEAEPAAVGGLRTGNFVPLRIEVRPRARR
jgi:hypothetical protein